MKNFWAGSSVVAESHAKATVCHLRADTCTFGRRSGQTKNDETPEKHRVFRAFYCVIANADELLWDQMVAPEMFKAGHHLKW